MLQPSRSLPARSAALAVLDGPTVEGRPMSADNRAKVTVPASAVYTVRTGRERIEPVRGFFRALWTWVVALSPLFWLVEEPYEVVVKNIVWVVRISDGVKVVGYRYRLLSEGHRHADSLRDRLQTMSATEFAEQLGIAE